MKSRHVHLTCLVSAMLAANACGGADPANTAAPTVNASGVNPDRGQANLVAAQIADTLQACSYDGTPVRFGMGGQAPRDCRDMIAQVMNFTGLPQNFDVTEANVPNAAAAILLDPDKLPHRVIAFNPDFIAEVRRETGGNPWSAVSIMAHEAGHHLAGHTIQAGGSQPQIELEADKFSGFVLYKMGASRDDALTALKTLVPEEVPVGASHPPRSRRVSALTEGWDQACHQTGRGDCTSGAPGSAPPPGIVADIARGEVASRPVAKSQPSTQVATQAPMASSAAAASAPVATTPVATPPIELERVIVLAPPDPGVLPSKGTQFIYDETGLLDPAIVATFEQQMFEHARDTGVEIVTLLVNDLHGMSAEAYGWAMLRQLRVGKLDVGNGAVLVIAPRQKQAAAVMGPGVALEMGTHDKGGQLRGWIDLGWPQCERQHACGNWTENLLMAADHIRRDTRDWDWTIRYRALADLQRQVEKESTVATRPQDSLAWRQIAQFGGTVVDLAPSGGAGAFVNSSKLRGGSKAVQVRSSDGLTVMFYLDPRIESLMPGGKLKQGGKYLFTARNSGVSRNPHDTHPLDLLSYVSAQ